MSLHAFVDESTHRGYLVASAVLLTGDLAKARKIIKGFILRGQRRIHFKKETNGRRRQIIGAIVDLGVEIVMYDASGQPDAHASRKACLDQLVADLAVRSARSLVLETDDSLIRADRQWLYERVRAVGCADRLRYDHQRAHEECLLCIPDAVARWVMQSRAERDLGREGSPAASSSAARCPGQRPNPGAPRGCPSGRAFA